MRLGDAGGGRESSKGERRVRLMNSLAGRGRRPRGIAETEKESEGGRGSSSWNFEESAQAQERPEVRAGWRASGMEVGHSDRPRTTTAQSTRHFPLFPTQARARRRRQASAASTLEVGGSSKSTLAESIHLANNIGGFLPVHVHCFFG